MFKMLLICVCVPQIERPATGSGLIRHDFDQLAPESAEQTKHAIRFRLDALQTARLARLDQLLALTRTQRDQLAKHLREDITRPFGGSALQVGPLLKNGRLKNVLTARQWAVFQRWREEGSLAWFARRSKRGASRIESDCRDAAMVVVDRMVTELDCTPAQRRRLEIAARGLPPRFREFFSDRYANLDETRPQQTTDFLLKDGTLVPLLDEIRFWQKTVTTTLSSEQRRRETELAAERLEFYRGANAMCTTADLQIGLPMTYAETAQFYDLMLERFVLTRPVYPLRESSHPVLQLKRADLEHILPENRLREFLKFTEEARRALLRSAKDDPAEREERKR